MKPVPTAAMVLALAAGGIALWWNGHRNPEPGTGSTNSNPAEAAATTITRPDPGFAAVETALRTGGGGSAQRTLSELRATLTALPREQAVAAIRAQLASGRDASTGLGFKIGAAGVLLEAPTLRTFLLEELARLDPAAAAELAQAILGSKTSADEWAVALRNVARVRADEAGRAFLEGKMRELLTHEPWQREASVGFLEAFDVAVHLRGTGLVPDLAALVCRTNNAPASHAAYLALDRLTIETPAALLGRLAEAPDLMAGREMTRANYFARADVSDPAQKLVLEGYLLDARRSPEELRKFAGLYPNANFMISQNLLTQVNTPDRATLMARDRAALDAVNAWLADPRFLTVRTSLEQARARLEYFVRQSN